MQILWNLSKNLKIQLKKTSTNEREWKEEENQLIGETWGRSAHARIQCQSAVSLFLYFYFFTSRKSSRLRVLYLNFSSLVKIKTQSSSFLYFIFEGVAAPMHWPINATLLMELKCVNTFVLQITKHFHVSTVREVFEWN